MSYPPSSVLFSGHVGLVEEEYDREEPNDDDKEDESFSSVAEISLNEKVESIRIMIQHNNITRKR